MLALWDFKTESITALQLDVRKKVNDSTVILEGINGQHDYHLTSARLPD